MIYEEYYLNKQKLLAGNKTTRRFWVFAAIYSVALVFIAGLYLLLNGSWKIAALAFAAFFLGRIIFSPIIYIFYKKMRPYQRFKFKTIHSRFLSPISTLHTSFPSDHAVSFSAITTVFLFYFPLLGGIFVVITLLNGWARVVLGYHYFIDIFGGWVVGIGSALSIIYFVVPRL